MFLLEFILEGLLEIVAQPVFAILLWLVWWIVLFPLACLVSAPAILLMAIDNPRKYWAGVRNKFGSILVYWQSHPLEEFLTSV